VGNFDSRSLPNSGDFADKIFKMSKFPWVARSHPSGGNIDRCITAACIYIRFKIHLIFKKILSNTQMQRELISFMCFQ
jgi:hypothetical protein